MSALCINAWDNDGKTVTISFRLRLRQELLINNVIDELICF